MNGILNQWWRLGGAFGIVFIVLFIIAGFGFQGETTDLDDPINKSAPTGRTRVRPTCWVTG